MYSPTPRVIFSASPDPLIVPVPNQFPEKFRTFDSTAPVSCPQQTDPVAPTEGETDGDAEREMDGETDARPPGVDGLVDGETEELGLTLADGDRLGLTEELGDKDGLSEELGDKLPLGDKLGLTGYMLKNMIFFIVR